MDPEASTTPTKIGAYRIVRKLGEGGMGAVFEALHEEIERRVAIKVLHPEFARLPEFISRFFNEARAVNRVDHPGLVQVSDYGRLPDGTSYIVMEFLKGESLGSRLKRLGLLPVEEAIYLARQVADALAAAHEQKIIHRDLKPDNVMIVPDAAMPGGERTKLVDFGIAKLAESAEKAQIKTRTNAVMGTPVYMSPEQCKGASHVDDKSDVYALGVMLFVMLSGQQPFTGEGTGEIIAKHIFQPPPSLKSVVSGVPEPLVELVHRLLQKDKQLRPSMRQLVAELDAMGGQPGAATRRSSSQMQKVQRISGKDVLLDQASTLGRSVGQSYLPVLARNRWVIVLAAVGGLIASFAVIVSWRARRPVAVVAVAKVVQPKVPQTVRWSVRSVPPGAQIIRLSDGQSLGATPYSTEMPMGSGELVVSLRLAGFEERTVRLDQGADAVVQETLAALPPRASPPAPPRLKKKTPAIAKSPPAVKVSAPPPKPAPAAVKPAVKRAYEE